MLSKECAEAAYLFEFDELSDEDLTISITSCRVEEQQATIIFESIAGEADWQLFGGSQLPTLSLDLTTETTFTETSPGTYQAQINLRTLFPPASSSKSSLKVPSTAPLKESADVRGAPRILRKTVIHIGGVTLSFQRKASQIPLE